MEEIIKCGDCTKHYTCNTCGEQCGFEGHFILKSETQDSLWIQVTEILGEDNDSSRDRRWDYYLQRLKTEFKISKK